MHRSSDIKNAPYWLKENNPKPTRELNECGLTSAGTAGALCSRSLASSYLYRVWRHGSDVTHPQVDPREGGGEGEPCCTLGERGTFLLARGEVGRNLAVVWISFLHNELDVQFLQFGISSHSILPKFEVNPFSILSSRPLLYFTYNSRQLSSVHFICNFLLSPFRRFVLHKVLLPGFSFCCLSWAMPDWTVTSGTTLTSMPDCRCQTNAVDLWKKCRCSIRLLPASSDAGW